MYGIPEGWQAASNFVNLKILGSLNYWVEIKLITHVVDNCMLSLTNQSQSCMDSCKYEPCVCCDDMHVGLQLHVKALSQRSSDTLEVRQGEKKDKSAVEADQKTWQQCLVCVAVFFLPACLKSEGNCTTQSKRALRASGSHQSMISEQIIVGHINPEY